MLPATLFILQAQSNDLSGLKPLQDFADAYAKTPRYLCILRSFQPTGETAPETEGTTEIWLQAPKARVFYVDMWGDGSTLVSDGSNVVTLSLYGDEEQTKAPESLAKGFGQGLDENGGIAVRLAGGAKGVETWVDVKKPVTMTKDQSLTKVSFTAKSGAQASLTFGGSLVKMEYVRREQGWWAPGGTVIEEVLRERPNPKVPKDWFKSPR